MGINRPNWGDGESRAVVPVENYAPAHNLPAVAGDQLQAEHPSADIALAPDAAFAQQVEAGLSPVDVETLNGAIEGWSDGLKNKLRAAMANPPLPGREARWLDKFQDSLTLAEEAELWAEAKIDPEFTVRLLQALIR